MATWEDGPEYAPLERPQGFEVPSVAPLEQAPEHRQYAAEAPKDRPRFDDPQAPVAPLATLVAEEGEQRDPALPFNLATGTVTSTESAWGAAHWNTASGPQVAAAPAFGAPWGPPTNASWPAPGGPPVAPTAPIPVVAGAVPQNGYPSPGTPGWFGPGPYYAQQAAPVDAKRVLDAITPGVAITLLVGGLIFPLSVVLLGVAFGLSSRIKVGLPIVRQAFFACFGVLGFFAIIGALTSSSSFSDWYGFVGRWALALCWAMLIAISLIVLRELRKGIQPTSHYQPPTSHWG